MIGQIINNLTIVKELTIPSKPYFQDVPCFLVKCKCGLNAIYRKTTVLNGRVKSCGDFNPDKDLSR